MINPAATVKDLIAGTPLVHTTSIKDLLAVLPMPERMPYFQTPVTLTPMPAMSVSGIATKNQASDVIVADAADTSIEDSARRLADMLKNRRNSNLELFISSAPTDDTYHAAEVIAKHLVAFKRTVESFRRDYPKPMVNRSRSIVPALSVPSR